MQRKCNLVAVLGIALMTVSCASLSSNCDDLSPADRPEPDKKGAKTLLKWAILEEEDKDAKNEKQKAEEKRKGNQESNKSSEEKDHSDAQKNGKGEEKENGGKENEQEDEPKPLEADRPDFTEASSTVGKGRVLLEAGYTYTSDRENGTRRHAHSFPEALLRVGMFADWFEFRIGQNFRSGRAVSTEVVESESGGEDLYLGVKLALTEQKKFLPESALVVQTTVPTGSELSADQLLPGLNYLFGWDVVKDCLSFGGSFQANRERDDTGHFYVEVAQSLTAGYTLTQRLGAYTEWFAFYPASSTDPEVGPEHYFNGGFIFRVTDDFQLDVRAGVGVNRRADDFFVGTGFAARY